MTRYRIMPSRSRVWIEARSNVHPIHTEAEGIEGWLDIDLLDDKVNVDRASRGYLEFPVGNLRSGNSLEDRELHRRIDARRYPTITGDLEGMKETTEPGRYIVAGDVTFRGVSRRYEDTMTVDAGDDRSVTMGGSSVFDIRDFGMEPPRMFLLKVQPEVTVRVEIVAEKEG